MRARRYLLTCYRYIELNPVRADMAGGHGEYRWSSYRWHGLGERNEVVTEHPLYLAPGASEEDRRAAYRTLFRAHLEEEALDEIRKAANRGLPLGKDRFREQVEAALGRPDGIAALRAAGRRAFKRPTAGTDGIGLVGGR